MKNNKNFHSKDDGSAKVILPIIIIALLVLLIGIVVIIYFNNFKKVEKFYGRLINTSIENYSNAVDERKNNENVKSELDFNINIDLEDEDTSFKKIVDTINKTSFKLTTQLDSQTNEIQADLESKYENDDFINANLYVDAENKNTYLKSSQLFDKYFSVDLDNEYYDAIKNSIDTSILDSSKKASKIIADEVNGMIKKEYCSQSKEKVDYNGKQIKTTKNTIKLSEEQFASELTTVLTNLQNNQSFIDCFKDDIQNDVKDQINSILNNLKYNTYNSDSYFELSTYVNGFFKENVLKIEMTYYDSYNEEKYQIVINKSDEKTYNFNLVGASEKILDGRLVINEKSKNKISLELTISAEDFGTIKLNINDNTSSDLNITTIDKNDTIKINDLDTGDIEEIYGNFQNTKLYEIIGASSEDEDEDKDDYDEDDEDID